MRYLLFLICCTVLITPAALGSERSNTVNKIQQVKKEITALNKALDQLKVDQSTAQKELRQTEVEIAQLTKQINSTQQELKKLESTLAQLYEDKTQAEEKLKEQEKAIATQTKATYENGRQEYIKLLLNQQDPEKVSRIIAYYDYLSQARLEQLSIFKETITQLKNIENSIISSQQTFNEQHQLLQDQQKTLIQKYKTRQQILATINTKIKDKNSQLSTKEQDQLALTRVLKTIDETLYQQTQTTQNTSGTQQPQKTIVSTFVSNKVTDSFLGSKGKLPWPVNGRIIATYGSTRGNDNRSKWDGVLISTTLGSPIKAIHSGRVVYSDWLRGLGLLTIIDHGGNNYSLYGYSQTLLKKVGQYVKAGEPIATVGINENRTPALYFSIRQKGHTVNPTLWCH